MFLVRMPVCVCVVKLELEPDGGHVELMVRDYRREWSLFDPTAGLLWVPKS